MNKRFIYIILSISFSLLVKAQLNNRLLNIPSTVFQEHHALSFNYLGVNASNVTNTIIFSNPISMQEPPKPIFYGSINDLPFFCAMECRVRKHTNIWIKLRTGNDESYMKLINSAAH